MIDLIRKNFWIVLVGIAFLLGILISPKPDKELREKYGKEREEIGKRIEEKEKEIQKLSREGEEMRKKVREDSVRYAVSLKTKDRNIHAHERTQELEEALRACSNEVAYLSHGAAKNVAGIVMKALTKESAPSKEIEELKKELPPYLTDFDASFVK